MTESVQSAAAAQSAEQPKKHKHFKPMSSKKRGQLIPVAQWLIFWLYVNIQSIALAFQDPHGAFTWGNFTMFWEELHATTGKTIGVAVLNTLIYFAVGILIQLPGALIIAYFLYKKIWLNKAFRVIFYLPAIISGVVMVAAYRSLVNPGGPLEALVELCGGHLPPEGLLANSNTATAMIVLFVIWTGFGGNMLLFGGAMARVPIDVLEAARLEGCGPFRELGRSSCLSSGRPSAPCSSSRSRASSTRRDPSFSLQTAITRRRPSTSGSF